MIDTDFIGFRLPVHTQLVDKGRLRFFAKAIGETNPVYLDEDSAKAAGWRSLPVPPTFLFCLDMERDNPYDYMVTLGIELGKVLHGEQQFSYHQVACAGDRLTFDSRITDIYQKKEGAMEFVVRDTAVVRETGEQKQEKVADLRSIIIIRHR
ncbi:N-terminal half of MaoC dehydratase [Marinobacter daqiaonensis]|uniref:N-terminal half of MaoC dehydratase n=1 Tax=Marinobacter daqiaonensis TaxID=650891 RepID=A0A1I6IMQ1_9GAMM|nr:MaoC family dehydratase N-terminal domain-containing protein [Marinobacter daqiaonensis]SFR68002.1 N-terminal half of MaoC dehydratase [Marinobacter daqiaonensis]